MPASIIYRKMYTKKGAVISMGTAANPFVDDLFTLLLFGVFPFDLVKHGITFIATYHIYKKCGNALREILCMGSQKMPDVS